MVHYHFKDKRDLILAVLVQARRDWIEPLEELVDGPGSAQARMRSGIAWIAQPAASDVMRVHLSIFVFSLGDETIRDRYAAEYARWRGPFVTLYRQLSIELGIEGLDAKSVGEGVASAAAGVGQEDCGQVWESLIDPVRAKHPELTLAVSPNQPGSATGGSCQQPRQARRPARCPQWVSGGSRCVRGPGSSSRRGGGRGRRARSGGGCAGGGARLPPRAPGDRWPPDPLHGPRLRDGPPGR